MNDKSLRIRYLIYFAVSFIILFIVLIYFKEKDIENVLNSYKIDVRNKYVLYKKELDLLAEFIYFNEFIKDNKVISILNTKYDLENTLYNHLEPSYTYYRSLDLNDIAFYDLNSLPIINFNANSYQGNLDGYFAQEVLKNRKDFVDYKDTLNEIYFVYSKPVFNEKLELVSVLNLEFNFFNILNKINNSSDLKYDIMILDEKQQNSNKYELFVDVFKSKFNEYPLFLVAKDLKTNNKIVSVRHFYNKLLVEAFFILALFIYLIYSIKSVTFKKDIFKSRYDKLFEQVDDNILRLDTDLRGIITYVSEYFCQETGYTKDEIVGKNANILRHPDMSIDFYKNFWKDLKEKKTWSGELKNKDKFGNTYWIHSKVFPIYNYKKEHVGYSSIRTNITAIKQLEETNKLLREDLSNKLNDIKTKDKSILNSTKVVLMSRILDSLSTQWQSAISKISFRVQKLKDKNCTKDSIEKIRNNIQIDLQELSDMLNDVTKIFSTEITTATNLFEVINDIDKKHIYEDTIDIKYDLLKNIRLYAPYYELKNIILYILGHIYEQTLLYQANKVRVKFSTQQVKNDSEVVLTIEDNIKDDRRVEYIDDILDSKDNNKHLDKKLHLAKLLIEKNNALLWYKAFEDKTIYYITFKSIGGK